MYLDLISFRLANVPMTDEPCELHHIVPKSLGGLNSKTNIVKLTITEHLVCHLLLPYMLVEQEDIMKMEFALAFMLSYIDQKGDFDFRAYGAAKQANRIANALMWTEERRAAQRERRLGTKDTEETKRRKREAAKSRPPIDPEVIKRRALSNTGLKRSAETCMNISTNKKLKLKDESRLKMSISGKARQAREALLPKKVMSEEERQRRSLAAKERERKRKIALETA